MNTQMYTNYPLKQVYLFMHKITFCLKRMNKNIFECPTINKNQATNAINVCHFDAIFQM